MPTTTPTESSPTVGLTMNMANTQPSAPRSGTTRGRRSVGRKLIRPRLDSASITTLMTA